MGGIQLFLIHQLLELFKRRPLDFRLRKKQRNHHLLQPTTHVWNATNIPNIDYKAKSQINTSSCRRLLKTRAKTLYAVLHLQHLMLQLVLLLVLLLLLLLLLLLATGLLHFKCLLWPLEWMNEKYKRYIMGKGRMLYFQNSSSKYLLSNVDCRCWCWMLLFLQLLVLLLQYHM